MARPSPPRCAAEGSRLLVCCADAARGLALSLGLIVCPTWILAAGLPAPSTSSPVNANPSASTIQSADPPGRVGQLSWVSGTVEADLGTREWRVALVNWPMGAGSAWRTARAARAELRLPNGTLRMGASSELAVLRLDEQMLDVELRAGRLSLRFREPRAGEIWRWRAESASVQAQDLPLDLHLDFNAAHHRLVARVFEGSVTLSLLQGLLSLAAGQQVTVDARYGAASAVQVAERTRLEDWADRRDARQDRLASGRGAPTDMTGVDLLDDHGVWRSDARIGPVWYPTSVGPDWAPFRFGRWLWVDPWGWTWIDDAVWGFAPSHYGRWLFVGGRWGWAPGPGGPPAVYAPAVVGFLAGPLEGTGSPTPAVGWFPLAPGEAYRPGFSASDAWSRAANASQGVPPIAPAPGNRLRASGGAGATSYRYAQASFAVTAAPRKALAQGESMQAARLLLPPALLATQTVNGRAPGRVEAALEGGEHAGAVARPAATPPAGPPGVSDETAAGRATPTGPAGASPRAAETRQQPAAASPRGHIPAGGPPRRAADPG